MIELKRQVSSRIYDQRKVLEVDTVGGGRELMKWDCRGIDMALDRGFILAHAVL
jgi:hypothetical protein